MRLFPNLNYQEDYFSKSKLLAWFLKTIGGLPFDRTGDEYGVHKNLKYIELSPSSNRLVYCDSKLLNKFRLYSFSFGAIMSLT